MNGADPGEFELRQSFRQAGRSLGINVRCVAGTFYFCSQPQLHFTGGLFGEGNCNDTVEGAYPLANQSNDPAHQRSGLARPGGRLDEQRGAEIC
jgi:hypothetical protein